ncbi:MAG: protein-L-isoaspartate O-methyltransferase family protein [Phyllobacterium sp.]
MTIDYNVLRFRMVDNQLRTTDVTSAAVLEAFLEVPREEFVPAAKKALAYIDEDLLVSGAGSDARYIMAPSPFARLLQLADIKPSDVALDIGCAYGYSSAILSRLASSVIAVESDSDLSAQAAATLTGRGYDNIAVVNNVLVEGYASEAPYDVIILNGAVDFIPDTLFDQLKDGGRLVAVEGTGNAGVAKIYIKDEGIVSGRRVFNAAIKPLPGFERAPAFEF